MLEIFAHCDSDLVCVAVRLTLVGTQEVGVAAQMTDEASSQGSGANPAASAALPTSPAPAIKKFWPSHRIVRHWLPWIFPLMAIGLPLLCSVVAASMSAKMWTAQFAAESSGRGDLLIPALIVCVESLRRWSSDVKGGYVVGGLRYSPSWYALPQRSFA
jgi:hypothetical protein